MPTDNHLLKKLWQVAEVQGHRNPFSPELMALNEAELDFILEMYVKDDPKRGKFSRGGEPKSVAEKLTSWEKFLIGAPRVKYMARYTMSPKARERAKMINEAARTLRAAPRRRGK